jgi:maltose O-acetyltransferase
VIWRLISGALQRIRGVCWSLIYRGYRSRYAIDPSFRFNGSGIQLYGEGRIELGADSYIGELSTIQASSGHRVRIGRACRISHNVRIYTETSDSDSDFRLGAGAVVRADVDIGEGAWIGVNVFIGPGAVIGANAVVGANSVVTRSIPADEIWGGVPARRIRAKRTSQTT